MAIEVKTPFEFFPDTSGLPLDGGRIYIGEVGLDPVSNPQTVYWDEPLTIEAAQPISTIGGFPARDGSAAKIYISGTYSIRVEDSDGALVFSSLENGIPEFGVSAIFTRSGSFVGDGVSSSFTILGLYDVATQVTLEIGGAEQAPDRYTVSAAGDGFSSVVTWLGHEGVSPEPFPLSADVVWNTRSKAAGVPGSLEDLSAEGFSDGQASVSARTVNFDSRASLVTWWGLYSADVPAGAVLSDGAVEYLKMPAGHVLFGTDPIADLPGLFAFGTVTPLHWGAVGNWDGATGADDTAAINHALAWWADGENRYLEFPPGWYFYDGSAVVDGDNGTTWNKGGKIVMFGQIWPADPGGTTGNPVAWEFKNLENIELVLRIRGGGKYGDFSTVTVNDGGTTFLQMHAIFWAKLHVESMNYKGRILHTTGKTDGGAARVRCLELSMQCGNRDTSVPTDPERDATGQILCADNTAQTANLGGSWGKIHYVRGEAARYGMLFENMTDLSMGEVEWGLCSRAPLLDLKGVTSFNIGTVYTADTDQGFNQPVIRLRDSDEGTETYRVVIDHLRADSGWQAVHASGGLADRQGLTISKMETNFLSDVAVTLDNYASSVNIKGAFVKEGVHAVETIGTCGPVTLNFEGVENTDEDAIVIGGIVDVLDISGRIGDVPATFHCINLGVTNNAVNLHDLYINASTAASKVNYTFAGNGEVRFVDSILEGTSANFGDRRPEYISGVRGCQTVQFGTATMLSGNTLVNVAHNLDVTPQIVTIQPIGTELGDARVSGIFTTQFDVRVPVAVTSNQSFYWEARAELLRGDTDA